MYLSTLYLGWHQALTAQAQKLDSTVSRLCSSLPFIYHQTRTSISQEWVGWAGGDLLLGWGTPWVGSCCCQLLGLVTMGDLPFLISVFLIPTEKSYQWKMLNVRPGSQDRLMPQAYPDWRAFLSPSGRPPCVKIPCAHPQHWTCPWSSY